MTRPPGPRRARPARARAAARGAAVLGAALAVLAGAPGAPAEEPAQAIRSARQALARGDLRTAQERFEAVLARDAAAPGPLGVDALVGLAEVDQRRGRGDRARELLTRALAREPWRPEAHARLAEITGRAARRGEVSGDAAVELAESHPYDPWSLLVAGRALARAGDAEAAAELFERAVWVGDVDPESAAAAAAALAPVSRDGRGARVVPVRLYGDEPIRREPGWRFRLRTVLLAASNALWPLLEVRFLPVSIEGFDGAQAGADLEAIHAAFTRATTPPPEDGMLAAFTGTPEPTGSGTPVRGLAELLGRRVTVRLPPRSLASRVLDHEILHLYGAMHVSDSFDSLMNADGDSRRLDALSQRTVLATRDRTFTTGGIEADVLPRSDVRALTDAYVAALSANLALRQAGIADLLDGRRPGTGVPARRLVHRLELDPHLADVARITAVLLLGEGRRDEAVALFETAGRLYGPDSPRGRESLSHARTLRRAMSGEAAGSTAPPTDTADPGPL